MVARRTGQFIRTRSASSAKPRPKILTHNNGKVSASLEFIEIQLKFNVRRNTEPDEELIKSIEENGVLNPIHVRWKDEKEDILYIVDGERRYKAAKWAKWSEIPVVCRGHIDDRDALVVSLTTNEGQKPLKREERAEGFKRLRDEGLSEKEISDVMGCSERTVAETLRLVDKATGPIRRAAMGNGGSKVRPGEEIPVRAASRAASLPANEQKKLATKMKGKNTEEALEEVRKVEEKLGIKTRGRKAKKGAKPKLNLKEMLVVVERRLKAALRHSPNSRTVRAQLDIIQVLKGEKDITEALPSPSRKKGKRGGAKKKTKEEKTDGR